MVAVAELAVTARQQVAAKRDGRRAERGEPDPWGRQARLSGAGFGAARLRCLYPLGKCRTIKKERGLGAAKACSLGRLKVRYGAREDREMRLRSKTLAGQGRCGEPWCEVRCCGPVPGCERAPTSSSNSRKNEYLLAEAGEILLQGCCLYFVVGQVWAILPAVRSTAKIFP